MTTQQEPNTKTTLDDLSREHMFRIVQFGHESYQIQFLIEIEDEGLKVIHVRPARLTEWQMWQLLLKYAETIKGLELESQDKAVAATELVSK